MKRKYAKQILFTNLFLAKSLKPQRCIQNAVKHLRWSFLSKNLMAASCSRFSQKNSSYILKSAKKPHEKLDTKETTSKIATTEFLSNFTDRKKICIEQFNLSEAKISLNEMIKSANSQTNY